MRLLWSYPVVEAPHPRTCPILVFATGDNVIDLAELLVSTLQENPRRHVLVVTRSEEFTQRDSHLLPTST